MILKTLYIKIDIPQTDQSIIDYTYDFKKKSRHICNYIERECLRKIKFKTSNFNRIVISLMDSPKEPYVNYFKVLCIPISWDKTAYDKIKTDSEFRVYIYDNITNALNMVKNDYDLPVSEILAELKKFKELNYKNNWVVKTKIERKRKIKSQLICDLNINKFLLTLKIEKDSSDFEKVILETDPDEIAYEYKFKDIKINENTLEVVSKNDEILFSYAL